MPIARQLRLMCAITPYGIARPDPTSSNWVLPVYWDRGSWELEAGAEEGAGGARVVEERRPMTAGAMARALDSEDEAALPH